MFPVLFKIGGFEVRTYGVMLLLAFLFAIWWVGRELKKHGIPKEKVWDLALWIMVASVIGARALFVWEHWAYFSHNIGEAFAVWHGGLTFYGGVLLAIPVAILFIKQQKWPFWKVADAIAPGLAAGIAIGRWGCWFNGCCYGKPTSLPWGVVYPPTAEPYQLYSGAPVHPSPLYESFAEWLLFAVLILWVRKKAPFDGFTLFFFVFFAALIRFLNDFTRHYEHTAFLFASLTFNQVIALGLMATALGFLIYLEMANKRSSAGA